MQSANKGKPPLGIIFDSAFGHRPDDPLALALLYHFDGRNDARMLSISVSTADLKAAASCAAISRFYRMTPERDPLPIGLFPSAKLREETPMTAGLTAKRDAEGAPLYRHGVEKLQDTADPLPLMRNALASQPDQTVVVIVTGPATNAARLLTLPGTKSLIEQKAKLLIFVAGAYPEGPVDFALRTDMAAAQKLFGEWPAPILAVGAETGNGVLFPAASIEKDFAWSPAHPVADAYRAYRPMPYDATTGALAAALYAVKPQEEYFKLSDSGTIQVFDDGRLKFVPSVTGKHRYLIVEENKKQEWLAAYIQLASAQPIPPPGRQRPPAAQPLKPPQISPNKPSPSGSAEKPDSPKFRD